MKKPYTNADFGKDLKKSFTKKRKSSNPIYPNGFSSPAGNNGSKNAGASYPTFGTSRSGGNMGGQSTVGLSDTQLQGMKLMKKNKKSKAKSSGKKKKMSMPKFSNGTNSFGGVKNAVKSMSRMTPKSPMPAMNRIGSPQPGGTTQALMDSAQGNSKVLFKKNKKSKEKGSKKKSSEKKKKVSHVLQESSMCKACKTSHKPGKHSVKKSPKHGGA